MARRPARPPRPVAATIAAGGLLVAAGLLARALRPPNVRITDPGGRPTIDASGARSVQAAELTIGQSAVDALWSPAGLDRLGRTYWRFLRRLTLGLIRVIHAPDARLLLVLLARPVVLLAFDPPEYVLDDDHRLIRWRIRGGLLVARPAGPSRPPAGPEPGGLLEIELRRIRATVPATAGVRLQIAVTGFDPAIARLLGPTVYAATQGRIHVILTHAFLRSLARTRPAPQAPRSP
ncbi:MAG TPA: hypothetical protein VHW26_03855 [Solirubrobacteraceae bacterium]|nr:hypothetical protein [Solirubrobacteraceae bacterium]